jgi:hypothetical protein
MIGRNIDDNDIGYVEKSFFLNAQKDCYGSLVELLPHDQEIIGSNLTWTGRIKPKTLK